MTDSQRQIIFVDQDIDFLSKAKEFSKRLKHKIVTISSIDILIPVLEKEGALIDIIAINIDPYSIDQLKRIKTQCSSGGLKHIKILSITSPFSKFSMSTVGKIKQLCPIDLIDKSHDPEKTLFRISSVIFSDSPKRKNQRAVVFIPVKCSHQNKNFDALSYSLSKEGIFLKTDETIDTDKELTITFSLPGLAFPIKTRCQVLYKLIDDTTAYRTSPKGIGLRFVGVSDETKEMIDKYVKENI
jgi:hypothetical protein